MFTVGGGIHYYAVDHSPSLLWNSATWEISEALLTHLRTVLAGPGAWDRDETIRRAIEIRDGTIKTRTFLPSSTAHRNTRTRSPVSITTRGAAGTRLAHTPSPTARPPPESGRTNHSSDSDSHPDTG